MLAPRCSLFILLIAYFVFGAYNQYSQYGSRGWDLIPHRAFWVREPPLQLKQLSYKADSNPSYLWLLPQADLPYVLQDLFRGNGRNSGGYSSL